MSNSANNSELPKNPKLAIILSILIGFGLLYAGYYFYQDLLELEMSGGTRRVQWMIYAVYEVAGAKGVWAAISVVGIGFFYHAYRLFKKLKG